MLLSQAFANKTFLNPDNPMNEITLKPAAKKRKRVDTSVLDKAIGYRLRLAQLKIFEEFRLAFKQMDIRPTDYAVLTLIANNPGRKQSEIASALAIKRANFVALVNRIENRGLAERRANQDRRSNALHLTPEGETFVQSMQTILDKHEADLAQKLGSGEECTAFLAALDRIIAW